MPKQPSRSTDATGIPGARGGRVRGVRSHESAVQRRLRTSSGSIKCTSARSLMDRASDYGSEGWKFESSRARHSELLSATNGVRYGGLTREVVCRMRVVFGMSFILKDRGRLLLATNWPINVV